MLSCAIWRGLIALEVLSIRSYYPTKDDADREKNVPLAVAHRGVFGISEYISKLRTKRKEDRESGSLKERRVS